MKLDLRQFPSYFGKYKRFKEGLPEKYVFDPESLKWHEWFTCWKCGNVFHKKNMNLQHNTIIKCTQCYETRNIHVANKYEIFQQTQMVLEKNKKTHRPCLML